MRLKQLSVFVIIFLFSIHLLPAQETKLSVESPYYSIYSHLYFLQNDSYQPEIAAKTLNAAGIDSLKRIQLAIQLKQILDGKGLYVKVNQLPNQSNYIDSLSKQSVYTLFPVELPQVYVEKVENQWLYSNETVQLIPKLHKEVYPFGTDILLNLLPKIGQNTIFGLALWQYLGALILLILTFLIHAVLNRIIRPIIQKLTESKLATNLISSDLIWSITRFISILITLQIITIFLPTLQLPIHLSNLAFLASKIISTILIVFILLRFIDVIILHAKRLSQTTVSKLDEQLVPIVKRSLQAIVVIGGIIQILRSLDVNITALIAGISIGGLALALAAQDTVKNLIGSAMIFVDRPFQIGDYISGSGFSGSVEEVGFRTTRLKTADSSIISVPNGTIANMSVTNMGVRVYRLYTTNIGITYDTSPESIEIFLKGLRQLIEKHPQTSSEQYYVHLTDLKDSSINIFFRAFLNVSSYSDELKVKEALILGIIRLAEALNINFAFPSTSVYVDGYPTPNSPKIEDDKEKELKAFFDNFEFK
jgi:MscS family membrane protein